MSKIMKMIRYFSVAALASLLAHSVWAAVGDTASVSNLETQFTKVDGATNVNINSLTIPESDDLPLGSVVTIQSIGVTYRNTSYVGKLTLDGHDSTSKDAAVSITLKGNQGNKTANLVRYNFDNVEVVVGKTVPITNAGNYSIYLPQPKVGNTVLGQSNYANYGLAYEIKYTVKTIPGAAVDYTCEVDGETATWNITPADVKLSDTFAFTGSGTVELPAGAASSTISIGQGVTLVVKESGLTKTSVTNNGTIKIVGGTTSAPIAVTMNDSADTSIGEIVVAANSVANIHATGGNKLYKVTGEDKDTSKVILTSGQNWGMTGGTTIRNCSLSIQGGCDFWFERASALDATVNLDIASGRTLNLGNPDSNFIIGALTGSGTIAKNNANDHLKLNIGAGKTCTSSVNLNGTPVTIVSGTLKAGKDNAFGTSTITIEEGAIFHLNGYVNDGGYTIVSNGGQITSDRQHRYANENSIGSLTLNADTSMVGGTRFGLTKADGSETTLALNGHTLNINFSVNNQTFNFRNTTVSGEGTIAIGEGTYALVYDNGTGSMTAENVAFTMTSTSKLELNTQGTLTVKDFDAAAGATIIGGNDNQGTLKVLGTCTGTFSAPKLDLANGAKVDGTITVTQALTLGSTIKMAEDASIHVAGTATVPATLPLVLDDNGVVVGTLANNDGVLTVSPVVDLSKIAALGGSSVALADGISLNLDTTVEGDALAITSTGTIQVFKPSNSWVVDGSAAVLSAHNITIDASKVTYWFENSLSEKAASYFGHEAAYWTNVYGGPTTVSSVGNTPVLAQWRELGGDKTLPQYYDGQSSNYEPILLDGKLMPYISVSEGYKQLRSDYYEGWELRMALVNDVCLEMQALGKLQGDVDMFIGVDATSKLIVDTFNNGNSKGKICVDIASFEGLTVNSGMIGNNNQNENAFEYTFRGNGSIKIGGEFDLGKSHKIKHVDIALSDIEGTKFTDIISKKLIGFTSHGPDMSVNWANDATISTGCTISTTPVSPLDVIGTASIALKDDGVYVEYVDYVAAHPPTYRWEHIGGSSSWGTDGAWKGLLDASANPTARTWDEANAKTETIVDDVVDGKFYINMAKPFYFYIDAAKSASVVVDKTVHATQTGYNPETEAEGTGSRHVIVRGTGNFSFNLPQIEGVDEQGAPLSSFDFSKYDVEMQAPVDATQMNGELGLRAKLTGPITLGPQTKIVFIAPEYEETIAYDYNIADREGSVEVRGAGTFIVPNTMTGIPFAKTEGGFLKYNITEGTVTAAAISGNGGVIKTGAGTLKITEAATFTGPLQIKEGAVEVIAPSQDSEHAAISVTVSEGAEMRLILSDLTQDYTAANVSGKVVFVTEDGRVLRSEGYTYKGTSTPGICSVGENEYHYIDLAITAAGSNGTVTMLAACAQNANIPAGVTIDTNGKAFTGAVTGAGTIVFNTTTPASAALTSNAFTAEGWTGTVWLKNIGATAFNANQPLVPAGDLIKLGNANSTLKLTDCRGYINDADGVNYPYTLELENGTGLNDNRPYAWTNLSGYTGRAHAFKALKGSGAFIATGNCHEIEKFGTIEGFSGTFILDWGKRIMVGNTTTTPANGGIAFAEGAKFDHTITVDAKGGISFGNTIVLGDEIASVGSTVIAGLPQPASIPAIAAEDKLLVYENGALKVAKTVAKIGETKYATVASAIDAMVSGAASEVTLVDETITELPAGYEAYKIAGGKIVAKSFYTITVEGEHIVSTTIPASVREDQAEISFMITPETDYVIKSVTVNGEAIEAVNGVYGCTISAATTIAITAELDTVMIDIPEVENTIVTIVDGEGNPIELEAGTITVQIGATVVVTYSAADGYIMTDVVTTLTAGETTTIAVPATGDIVPAVAQVGGTLYATLADAVAQGGEVTLLQNVDTTTQIEIGDGNTVTLNLNDKTIAYTGTTTLASGVILVHNGGTLTVNGGGSILSGDKAYGAIALTKKGDDATKTATLVVNGGALTGSYYGIVGNGSRHNTSVTVNGGVITGTEGTGIYNPQEGSLEITGGTITGGETGVEIRSGSLSVTGGTISSTATSFEVQGNGSGTTTIGAAIAISQHTTKKAIDVEITGGTISGPKAIAVVNAQGATAAQFKVNVALKGGTFSGDLTVVGDVDGATVTKDEAASVAAPAGYKWADGTLVLDVPVATVTTITKEGLDSAYSFATTEETANEYFADWNADFIVTFDKNVAEGTVKLAGQYDGFGTSWVDFNLGAATAGTGISLLKAAGVDEDFAVTYAVLCETVKVFNCGVKNLDKANAGKKMTVDLVLSNGEKTITISSTEYTLVAPIEITEEEVKPTTEEIQVVVPTGADSIVITSDDVVVEEGATSIPLTTGLYTISAMKNGVEVATEQVGVIAAKDAEDSADAKVTTAVAVPFDGATVANLLNTALLSNGDTLMAYITVGEKSGYAKWTLTDGAWVGNDITGGIAAQPDTTALKRGTAVWVTSAGKVVVLGKYNEEDEIAAPTAKETHLLANPTMKDYTPTVKSTDAEDQVMMVGEATPTRFTKKNGAWTKSAVKKYINGNPVYGDVTEAPVIPVGKGFWFIKK